MKICPTNRAQVNFGVKQALGACRVSQNRWIIEAVEITSLDREARNDEQAAVAELRLVEPGLGAEDVVVDADFLRRVYYFLLPGTVPTEHLLEANNVEVGQVLIDELFESLVLVVPASRLNSKRAQIEIQRQ